MTKHCTVRVTCDTGHSWVTSINCTFQQAIEYFTGFITTTETDDGKETSHTVIRIEAI